MEFLLIIISFIVLFLIARAFTVLFHELGHAIPAIFFSQKPASIYIGSYGDPKKCLHFKIGRLELWLKYNPLSWQNGLCISSINELSISKLVFCTLTGPLASFLIATISCYVTFSLNLHGALKLIILFFFVSSIFDLFVNLVPNAKPNKLNNGKLTYNDGYQLKQLFYYSRNRKAFEKAIELFEQKKYSEAASSSNQILKKGIKNPHIYRLAIIAYLQMKNYKQARDLSDEFIAQGLEMNSDDFANVGISYSHLDLLDKALEFYDKSLELNPKNKYALNNKGYTLTILKKYEEAIPLFDQAIEVDEVFAYAYNNRGLAKIKTGKALEGLEDINHSYILDQNNSYYFRNLGIYHLEKGDKTTAFE